MAINRLGNHTEKKKHKARLAEFYLNPLTLVGYRNICFFSHTNPYNLNVTQQLRAWASCDVCGANTRGVCVGT